MNTSTSEVERTPSIAAIALYLLPLAVLCVGVVLMQSPYNLARFAPVETLLAASAALFLGGYLLTLAAVLVGWLKGFPRWSMPYLAYGFIFGTYMVFVATPGIVIFGVPVWGREIWGLRACVPALLVAALGIAFSRPPLQRITELLRHIWNDWTYLAYGIYGFLPLMLPIIQDEIEHAFTFWPTVAAVIITLTGAALYLRFARKPYRSVFLLGGIFLAIMVVSVNANFYWETHSVNMQTFEVTPLDISAPWPTIITRALSTAGIWTLIMAATGLLGVLHRLVDRGTPAGNPAQ